MIRHKLVDMAQKVAASQAMLEMLAWRLDQGESPVAEICMLKNQATQTMAFCASEAVQIFGGAGFMRGIKVERIYREVKVNAIGGGSEEIMKDLASRQMGPSPLRARPASEPGSITPSSMEFRCAKADPDRRAIKRKTT